MSLLRPDVIKQHKPNQTKLYKIIKMINFDKPQEDLDHEKVSHGILLMARARHYVGVHTVHVEKTCMNVNLYANIVRRETTYRAKLSILKRDLKNILCLVVYEVFIKPKYSIPLYKFSSGCKN